MAQFRKTFSLAGSVAQLLGLSIAILLLTPTGREGIARFGLPAVLLASLSVFLVVELVVLLIIHRVHRKSTLPDASSCVNVDTAARKQSH